MEKSRIQDKHSGSAILVPSWTIPKRSVLVLFVQCPAVAKNTITIMQCCGSWVFIPGPRFFHPESRIRIFSIPYPGSTSKNLNILTQNGFFSSRKCDPGCSSLIRILIFYASWIPVPEVKKAPAPGSATLPVWKHLCA
jgi:hypothetical protein